MQGYLSVEMPGRKQKQTQTKQPEPQEEVTPQKTEPEPESESEIAESGQEILSSSDDVISNIGPQAMALLASGQNREHEGAYFQL